MSTKVKLISAESKDFEAVLESIRKHQRCRNDVSRDFITVYIRPDTITDVLLIGSADQIFGFVCLIRRPDYVEIKLLCTEQNNLYYGYDLLLHVVDVCRKWNKTYIFLEALDTAVGFYRSFGFTIGTMTMQRDNPDYMTYADTWRDDGYYPMILDVRQFDEKTFQAKVAEASLKRDYPSLFK
jgi:hypothetical protein